MSGLYDEIEELKVIEDEKVANESIRVEGWKLLAIKEKSIVAKSVSGQPQVTQCPVFVFGRVRKSSAPTTPTKQTPATSNTPATSKPPAAVHQFTSRAFSKEKSGAALTCKDYGSKRGCGAPITMDVGEDGKWHAWNADGTKHSCGGAK